MIRLYSFGLFIFFIISFIPGSLQFWTFFHCDWKSLTVTLFKNQLLCFLIESNSHLFACQRKFFLAKSRTFQQMFLRVVALPNDRNKGTNVPFSLNVRTKSDKLLLIVQMSCVTFKGVDTTSGYFDTIKYLFPEAVIRNVPRMTIAILSEGLSEICSFNLPLLFIFGLGGTEIISFVPLISLAYPQNYSVHINMRPSARLLWSFFNATSIHVFGNIAW